MAINTTAEQLADDAARYELRQLSEGASGLLLHHIRNRAQAILTNAELIRMQPETADQRAENIAANVHRLDREINILLGVERFPL